MKHVLVPIADGSEEIEAVTVIDVLRRAGASVTVASVMEHRLVTAARGVKIEADVFVNEDLPTEWDLIALPGGMPGADHLQQSPELLVRLREQFHNDRWIGAICAAPAVVLGRHHLIKDYRATCFPKFQDELASQSGQVLQDKVVIDRNLITSQGPGTATDFALALTQVLYGDQKVQEISQALVHQNR